VAEHFISFHQFLLPERRPLAFLPDAVSAHGLAIKSFS
jgi:hypothetical protein